MSMDPHTHALIERAKRAPSVSAEEELECIRAWQTNKDRRAAGRIVEANARHVVYTALKFKNYGIPVNDLISDGYFGLLKALDRFDEQRGVRFSTYAGYWIRAQIIGCVLSSWSVISGPRNALTSRMFFRLRRQRALLGNLTQDDPSAGDTVTTRLAQEFGVSEQRMQDMLHQLDNRGLSLDARDPVLGTTLLDELESDTNQEQQLSSEQARERLERVVDRTRPRLDPRETFILERRLMADPEDRLSLGDISTHFGVSRERVRQIEVRARARLQDEARREAPELSADDGTAADVRAA
jgi:RNA polymerase sigma-32 factor